MIWACDVAVCGVRQVTSHSPYATSCSTEQSEDFTSRVVPLHLRQAICDELRVNLYCNYAASYVRPKITPQMPYVITGSTAPKALFWGDFSHIMTYFGFGSFAEMSHVSIMTILCPLGN